MEIATPDATPKWFSGSHTKDGIRELVSGMLAGFVCKVVEYPLDTVKVLMQTQATPTGPVETVLRVQREHGLRSLYQGLSSPLVGSMLECSILFVAFDYVKKVLGAEDDSLSSTVPKWKVCLSGASGGMMTACVLTPIELIKCRLQIQQGAERLYQGPIDCLVKTVKEGGLRGLWKGNVSCLARELPGNAAWFGAYDTIIKQVQRQYRIERREDVPLKWSAVAGAFAGTAYWLIPYPADTVKSRIQTNPAYQGMSFVQVLQTVVREEGFGGLYRGCGLTCARAIPSNALIFYFHAMASNFLTRY
eukprot:EG_transcript_17132